MTLARRLSSQLVTTAEPIEGILEPEEAPSVIEMVNSVLEKRKKTFHFFRPSMIAKCERANVFHYRRSPVSPAQQDPRLHRILDTGTALHTVFQDYLADLHDWWFVPEARVYETVEGAWVRGSCDGVLIRRSDMYRFAIELKTINHDAFMKLAKPQEEHAEQALLYVELMGLPGTMIVYWDKNNSNLKEFWVPARPEAWTKQKKKIRRLKQFIDNKTLPDYDPATCDSGFCNSVDICRRNGAPV